MSAVELPMPSCSLRTVAKIETFEARPNCFHRLHRFALAVRGKSISAASWRSQIVAMLASKASRSSGPNRRAASTTWYL